MGAFLGLHACMMCAREWMSDALTGGGDGWMSYDGFLIYIPVSTKGQEDGEVNEGVRYVKYLISS